MQNLKRIVAASVVCAVLVLLLGQAQAGRAQGPQPRAPQTALGSAFSYQGQLKKNGSPYTGDCNFQFSLWDDLNAGTQQGNTQSLNTVSVGSGNFAVTLDFGSQFDGSARWLGMAVQCTGDGGFTALLPRTELAPVPYALYAPDAGNANSAGIAKSADTAGYALSAGTADSAGIAKSADTAGYALSLAPGSVVSGTNGQVLRINAANGNAVVAVSSADGYAASYGGDFSVNGGFGTYGESMTGDGAKGIAHRTGKAGVRGVYDGTNNGGTGCFFCGGWGVAGAATGGAYGAGVFGTHGGPYFNYAGQFDGDVYVGGTLSKAAGSFKIDHPLDPANKYLSHSFVESPDMMNVYNGNITTDAKGDATVVLPAYFEALNKDYRYQLTVIGTFAQAIVSAKIKDNRFSIKTDKPNVEVSWQVTGIRHDPYAEQHPIIVEQEKPAQERGKYQFPELYGAPPEQGVFYAARSALGAATGGVK